MKSLGRKWWPKSYRRRRRTLCTEIRGSYKQYLLIQLSESSTRLVLDHRRFWKGRTTLRNKRYMSNAGFPIMHQEFPISRTVPIQQRIWLIRQVINPSQLATRAGRKIALQQCRWSKTWHCNWMISKQRAKIPGIHHLRARVSRSIRKRWRMWEIQERRLLRIMSQHQICTYTDQEAPTWIAEPN